MRIRIIAPITTPAFSETAQKVYAAQARSDACISAVCLERGPASVESIYEDALAAPGVVAAAIQAERDGVDAVVIDCMNDPGMEAAREAVYIPVVGAAQASMLLAAMLAHKFSVVSTAGRDVYPTALLARRYGIASSHASTRWVDIPVLELRDDHDRLLAAHRTIQPALPEREWNDGNVAGGHSIQYPTARHAVLRDGHRPRRVLACREQHPSEQTPACEKARCGQLMGGVVPRGAQCNRSGESWPFGCRRLR